MQSGPSTPRYSNDGERSPSATAPLMLPRVSNSGPRPPFARPNVPASPSPSLRDLYSATELDAPPSPLYALSNRSSVSSRFSLLPDPKQWDMATTPDVPEPDDGLHTPDPKRDKTIDMGGTICTVRGIWNLGCLFILGCVLFGLFAGFPIASHFLKKKPQSLKSFNLGGIGTNATGQVPAVNFGLIDNDTPQDVYTKTSYIDGSTLELVFSDEFNVEGRSFYPGDDPYWEAVDLHYWATGNLEWYDPKMLTTKDGYLYITLTNASEHGMNYTGGMMSSWNKFCFTGGLLEASVSLPGPNDVHGLWPAVWAMGNLGRAGYGATLDGTWPYTYDSCDVGTVANQTKNGLPVAATEDGDKSHGDVLSYLPGQRLSRCTCPGESHPGPIHEDGTYVGRSAPEIDVFEATITYTTPMQGQVSQSGQWAPFNWKYEWYNTSDNLIISDDDVTKFNDYLGGVYQQASSCLSMTNQQAYETNGGLFSVYAFEYKPGFDDAYIGWVNDGKLAWKLNQGGMAADDVVQIGSRPVPQEPMYIILNLGISESFGFVDFDNLPFPTSMRVDYVRVYQKPGEKNIGCDPPDFPTAAYINEYIEAYTNPNLTTWVDDYGQTNPKNSFLGEC